MKRQHLTIPVSVVLALCALSSSAHAQGSTQDSKPQSADRQSTDRQGKGKQGAGKPGKGKQDAGKPEKGKQDQRQSEKQKFAWPKLKLVRQSLAKDKIRELTSKKADKARKARELITKYGAGVAPVLLGALSQRAKPALVEQLEKILDEVVQPQHAWPLSSAYSGKNERRDLYVVRRLDRFEIKELLPFFVRASKSKYPSVASKAQYARARLGDVGTLDFLHKEALDHWADRNYQIREAATALKGKPATDWLMRKLLEKNIASRVATLHILGVAGTKEAVSGIRSLLDAQEHQLRAGAVNALRGIVDGDPPFRRLSVFQAIEEVKKWKRRVGG